MPTYQYRCPECRYEFEEFQSINDDPVQTCPRCGKKPHRVITGGAGFLLKGSGFYSTDYRSESYKAAARRDTDSPSSSAPSKTDSSKTASSGTKSTS
jgi:putative FmdB family regulatory protein